MIFARAPYDLLFRGKKPFKKNWANIRGNRRRFRDDLRSKKGVGEEKAGPPSALLANFR